MTEMCYCESMYSSMNGACVTCTHACVSDL